jgi:hypothetical protein
LGGEAPTIAYREQAASNELNTIFANPKKRRLYKEETYKSIKIVQGGKTSKTG